ncbi:MAG: DNA-3-methyladenine glycosylase 2 family protein [Acidimicrobiia bacterium]|nr:DNA-3-methyladenine glycosylase 2 family protein [Acidimicrobiia bacterium]
MLQTRDGVTRYAQWTAAGPATIRLRRVGDELVADALGPGAELALDAVPGALGIADDPARFEPESALLRRLHRRFAGFRLGANGRVFDTILPTVLGQRVTTDEASRGYRNLIQRVAEPAPDQPNLYLPPRPEAVLGLSLADFHQLGVEQSRARIVREVARRASRLEEITAMQQADAVTRLEAVRGVGPWTSAQVMGAAWGDRDAIPLGDFHLPHTVSWALAGEPRGSDDRMLELLEPYRPQRRRALLLIKMAKIQAPRYGPRSPKSIISRGGRY